MQDYQSHAIDKVGKKNIGILYYVLARNAPVQ